MCYNTLMATKKTTKSPSAKAKQQKQLAASVAPLLTIIGVLAVVTLLLGFYITLTS
jgi:hypothetical protein